jgi:hypothetical protein
MDELLDAIRARRDALNISHETIDAISGLQPGYAGKLLAPKPIRNLGPMSFGALLGALGLAVVVVEDSERVSHLAKRWQPRKRPQKLAPLSSPCQAAETPETRAQLELSARMSEMGKRGGKRRLKTMSRRARQRIAAHAARIRWSKRREI